jgi:hypothetical protein
MKSGKKKLNYTKKTAAKRMKIKIKIKNKLEENIEKKNHFNKMKKKLKE